MTKKWRKPDPQELARHRYDEENPFSVSTRCWTRLNGCIMPHCECACHDEDDKESAGE